MKKKRNGSHLYDRTLETMTMWLHQNSKICLIRTTDTDCHWSFSWNDVATFILSIAFNIFFFERSRHIYISRVRLIRMCVRSDIWMCEEERGQRINDKPKIYHQRNTNTRSHACKKQKNSEKKKQQNNELSIYLSIWFGPTLCACLAIDTQRCQSFICVLAICGIVRMVSAFS